MRILVTGPESSGTSLVSRILRSAGAEVSHRSATYPDDWPDLRVLANSCDAVVVVFRDPFATMASQEGQGLSPHNAKRKLRDGYAQLFCAFGRYEEPLYVITYEQLVLNPNSIKPLLYTLGLNTLAEIEEVTNENEKYHGREWRDVSVTHVAGKRITGIHAW